MGPTWDILMSVPLKTMLFGRELGAVEKTRTSTGCPTATSTLRVYQFRHDRTQLEAGSHRHRACSKSDLGKQAPFFKKTKKNTHKTTEATHWTRSRFISICDGQFQYLMG